MPHPSMLTLDKPPNSPACVVSTRVLHCPLPASQFLLVAYLHGPQLPASSHNCPYVCSLGACVWGGCSWLCEVHQQLPPTLRVDGPGWSRLGAETGDKRQLPGQQALFTECSSRNSLLSLVSGSIRMHLQQAKLPQAMDACEIPTAVFAEGSRQVFPEEATTL